jgi:hypothetical protein
MVLRRVRGSGKMRVIRERVRERYDNVQSKVDRRSSPPVIGESHDIGPRMPLFGDWLDRQVFNDRTANNY